MPPPCPPRPIRPCISTPTDVAAVQCRINHMAEAAYATGPALTLFYFFPEFFVPCFSARPKQCASASAKQCAQRAQVPHKTRSPQKRPQTGFFVPCFSVSARHSKEPKVLRKRYRPQNLKIEAPKCRAPNDFFVPYFSAGSKQRGAL